MIAVPVFCASRTDVSLPHQANFHHSSTVPQRHYDAIHAIITPVVFLFTFTQIGGITMSYQQGYVPQQAPQQQWQAPPQPAQSRPMMQSQQIKFYKSGLFGFSSAAGRFQRDTVPMQNSGWQLQYAAYLGANMFL